MLKFFILLLLSFSALSAQPHDASSDAWLRHTCKNFDTVLSENRSSPPAQKRELEKLYQQAHRHQVNAQTELGDRYIDGRALPKDWKKALCWYRTAASNGSAYAEYWLGIFYQNGFVVPESVDRSAYWFSRAQLHDNSRGTVETRVAERYADDAAGIQDMGQALFWYTRAAAKHNVKAQLALGNFYINSHEPPDVRRALNWYGKAASQHSIEAHYNIGQIYYHGQAISQDFREAYKSFLLAAKAGYAPAQYDLAEMYYEGLGVQQNWVTSYAWLATTGAAENNPAALHFQETLTESFTPELLEQASRLAADYRQRYGQRRNHS